MIGAEMPLEPVAPNYPGEVVERWRYRGGIGEIGVIASVTRLFCGGCTRARLSAEGKLFTCLFAVAGHDLRALLRGGASDAEISAAIGGSGGCARTATRSCARPRQPACPRSRCPTSAGRPLGRVLRRLRHARRIAAKSSQASTSRGSARSTRSVRTRSGPRSYFFAASK